MTALALAGCTSPSPRLQDQVEARVEIDVCSEDVCFVTGVPGASVEVLQGETVLQSATTGDDGLASFTTLPRGEFELVARWGDLTAGPAVIVVENSSVTVSLRFPQGAG